MDVEQSLALPPFMCYLLQKVHQSKKGIKNIRSLHLVQYLPFLIFFFFSSCGSFPSLM